jgi:hypothetical protein
MLRRHLLAFAFVLTTVTVGCGGVESDQQIPVEEGAPAQHESLAKSCESLNYTLCLAEGSETTCVFNSGAPGLCQCSSRRWACFVDG